MIINFAKAEMIYGSNEDIIKSEMLQYVNFMSPRHIEEVVSSHVHKNQTLTFGLLKQHLGAAKSIK